MNETLKFESKITKFETLNPLFSKVKIKIAYVGLNRNGSYISKESFEKALPSIFHCPIIGEYSESVEDFRGHGGKIEITDDGIKFVNTTIPYGVIDSDTEITWEDIEEADGTINSYLCATGYLWTGRFQQLEQLIENSKSQSMEIEIVSGNYTQFEDQKVYEITDFLFSGFCILGDDVEPCFESSEVVTYSLDKSKFKNQFNQLVAELKFSLQQTNEGGTKMDKKLEMLEQFSQLGEDVLEQIKKSLDSYSLEDLENKLFQMSESTPREEEPVKFILTSEQLEDELKRELGEIEIIQDEYWEDYSYPRFNFVDYMPEQMVVVAYDCKENILVGLNYSLTNENVEVNVDSVVRYKVEFVPMNLAGDTDGDIDVFSKNFTSLSQVDHKVKIKENELNKQFEVEKSSAQDVLDKAYSDFAKLQEDYSKLEETKNELEQFKLSNVQKEREDAENELFERFINSNFGLTEDDLTPIKENKANFTIEELEEKLFALAGRKKLSFSKIPEQKPIRFKLPIDNKLSSDKEWADLVEQHKSK